MDSKILGPLLEYRSPSISSSSSLLRAFLFLSSGCGGKAEDRLSPKIYSAGRSGRSGGRSSFIDEWRLDSDGIFGPA